MEHAVQEGFSTQDGALEAPLGWGTEHAVCPACASPSLDDWTAPASDVTRREGVRTPVGRSRVAQGANAAQEGGSGVIKEECAGKSHGMKQVL